MMKKKHIVGLLLSALLVGCTPGGTINQTSNGTEAGKTELKKVTFLLDWTPNTNHTGLFVAKDKGYFAAEGLDVDIKTPPQGGAPQLVAAGNADFGIDFQDTLAPALAAEEPLPVTSVATILQHNTSGIISRKGEGIDRPKGMEGKKYATWDNPVEKAIIQNVVESDGGDFSSVTLIPNNITDEVAALKTNQIDTVWIYYGWSGINAQVQEFEFDYFAFKDINPVFDYYTPVILAADKLIKEDPETVEKFVRAASRGYTWAAENPEDAGKILLDNAPELNEKLAMESQQWMSTQYLDEGKPWGIVDSKRWDDFYGWLWENGLIEQEIHAGKGFTNDFIEQ